MIKNEGRLFDCILRLEDTARLRSGSCVGSGRRSSSGLQTGELLGFYKGCSSLWNTPALLVHLSPPQLHKHLHDFQALLIKDDLRVKFNIIRSSLSAYPRNYWCTRDTPTQRVLSLYVLHLY